MIMKVYPVLSWDGKDNGKILGIYVSNQMAHRKIRKEVNKRYPAKKDKRGMKIRTDKRKKALDNMYILEFSLKGMEHIGGRVFRNHGIHKIKNKLGLFLYG